jgi:hypothetical protein
VAVTTMPTTSPFILLQARILSIDW